MTAKQDGSMSLVRMTSSGVVSSISQCDSVSKTTREKSDAEYLFKYLILTQIVLYLEAGAIPCLLDELTKAANLDAQQQGALGGVVYLGLSLASPFCGYLFKYYDCPRLILGSSLIFNNLTVLFFGLIPVSNKYYSGMLLILSRGLIGFTQAFACVYTPLWVDMYAPPNKIAGWMSYLQGSVPLGIMFGYSIGSLFNWFKRDRCLLLLCWRWPFIIQFLLVLPVTFAIFIVPENHLKIQIKKKKTIKSPMIQSIISKEKDDTSIEKKMNNELDKKVETPALRRSISYMSHLENNKMIPDYIEKPIYEHHPHVVLDHREPNVRWTFHGAIPEKLDQLNLPQRSAIRASYLLPRIRLDSYDIDDCELRLISRQTAPASAPGGGVKYATFDISYNPTVPEEEIKNNTNDTTTFQISPSGSSDLTSLSPKEIEYVYEDDISVCGSIMTLLKIPIFVLIVMGLTAVYFVVTGVQYWSTIFMIKSLKGSVYLVNSLFVLISGTGPILGVFFGGWLIDRAGGYKGVINRSKALEICIYLGVVAVVTSFSATIFYDIYLTAVFLWLLLFFGGSILPACTGIFISVTPRQHRAFASSISVMIFNLLGYSLSPYLTGYVMNWILVNSKKKNTYFKDCDEACAYRIGFRFCLCWCIWSLICIFIAWCFAKRDTRLYLENKINENKLNKTKDVIKIKH